MNGRGAGLREGGGAHTGGEDASDNTYRVELTTFVEHHDMILFRSKRNSRSQSRALFNPTSISFSVSHSLRWITCSSPCSASPSTSFPIEISAYSNLPNFEDCRSSMSACELHSSTHAQLCPDAHEGLSPTPEAQESRCRLGAAHQSRLSRSLVFGEVFRSRV